MQILEKRKFVEGICIYCGKPIEGIGNNPEDYNLHNINREKIGTCAFCDKLITIPNRYLSMALQQLKEHNFDEARHCINMAIVELQECKAKI